MTMESFSSFFETGSGKANHLLARDYDYILMCRRIDILEQSLSQTAISRTAVILIGIRLYYILSVPNNGSK